MASAVPEHKLSARRCCCEELHFEPRWFVQPQYTLCASEVIKSCEVPIESFTHFQVSSCVFADVNKQLCRFITLTGIQQVSVCVYILSAWALETELSSPLSPLLPTSATSVSNTAAITHELQRDLSNTIESLNFREVTELHPLTLYTLKHQCHHCTTASLYWQLHVNWTVITINNIFTSVSFKKNFFFVLQATISTALSPFAPKA